MGKFEITVCPAVVAAEKAKSVIEMGRQGKTPPKSGRCGRFSTHTQSG